MGPLFKRVGHVKIQFILATSGLCIFGGIMAATNENRQNLAIAVTIMTGFFVGWCELVAIVIAGLVVPPEEIGVAQGFFGSTRAITGTVAGKQPHFYIFNDFSSLTCLLASIYLAIYGGRLGVNLPSKVTSAALGAGLPQSSVNGLLVALGNGTTAAYSQVPGVNSAVLASIGQATKSAYSASFSTVYLSSLAFGGVALIASFFTTNIDQYLTGFVNKTVAGRKQVRGGAMSESEKYTQA